MPVSRRTFLGGLAAGTLGALLGQPWAEAAPSGPLPLLECHIAGTTYRPKGLADVEPSLIHGACLRLRREPQNLHDDLAIAVYDLQQRHLGYVPMAKNEVLAHLMDAGYKLSARLEQKAWVGTWLKLEMTVLLDGSP